jgi:hypothetical protein
MISIIREWLINVLRRAVGLSVGDACGCGTETGDEGAGSPSRDSDSNGL